MARVSLRHIYKVYDGKVKAVSDFNLEVEDKEFIVFVGPSGCGKSTTLRMVAGLEEITAGELWIGDTMCNHVEAKNRNISMVFQNYALFPNMSVYDNMAFGLRMHKIPREEIDKRVRGAAEILGITEYLNRKPKALSGGQRQRVALGRAIVREPSVFLFDEPLSNLDAKLRARMRTEITRLHKRLQSTFIYVTHDQVEAMTMGDRIVVMKDGCIQQTDTPQNLFRWPANKFVAGFIGTPQMNFFSATLKKQSDGSVEVRTKGFGLIIPAEHSYRLDEKYLDGDIEVIMGIRPDDIKPVKQASRGAEILASVALVEELGTQTLIYANTDADELMNENSPTAFCASAGENTGIIAGNDVAFEADTSKLYFFDAHTELSIKRRIPDVTVRADIADGYIAMLGGKLKLPPALASVLGNGCYDAYIPSDAFSFAGGISGTVEDTEELGGGRCLSRVRCGEARIFVAGEEHNSAGDCVSVSVAFEKITFMRNKLAVAEALPQENRLNGTYVRLKEGKNKNHYIVIGGVKVPAPMDFNQKMYDVGRTIFKRKLAFGEEPDCISFADDGVPVQVDKVLDYGCAQYAVMELGGQKLYIRLDGPVPEEPHIKFDFSRIKVYDSDIDMRLF